MYLLKFLDSFQGDLQVEQITVVPLRDGQDINDYSQT